MMSRQDQHAGPAAEAYQAGHDLIIHRSMSAEQIGEVITGVARHLQVYVAEAEDRANSRLEEFKAVVVERFTKLDEVEAKPEAFRDPDFQFALSQAQQAFVRRGDQELRDELVALLVKRSAEEPTSRRALVLNDAIATAGKLTREDRAALVTVFVLRHMSLNAPIRGPAMSALNGHLSLFLDDLPASVACVEYLIMLRCVFARQFGEDLANTLHSNYHDLCNAGFSGDAFREAIGNEDARKLSGILAPGPVAHSTFRFFMPPKADLHQELLARNLSEDAAGKLFALHQAGEPKPGEVELIMLREISALGRISEIWTSSGLSGMMLTPLGKAIAFSILVGVPVSTRR